MKWIACELHTHTVHSDGQFTLSTLTQRAAEIGLDAVALTDHNAVSAIGEAETGDYPCGIINGLEWTTYYGHVLVLGASRYVDWRDVTPENIDEKLRAVKAAGGLTGMAHPYAAGGPVCCGCFWEFRLQDWALLDYLEIWSGGTPQLTGYNRRARELWNRLLDRGFRTTAVSARDWHGGEDDSKPYGVTYLLVDENETLTDAAKDALKKHRAFVSVGPELTEFSARRALHTAQIGESMTPGKVSVTLRFQVGRRFHAWKNFHIKPEKIVLLHSGGVLAEMPYEEDVMLTVNAVEPEKWMRAEVWGTMNGSRCELLVSNPIFIEG